MGENACIDIWILFIHLRAFQIESDNLIWLDDLILVLAAVGFHTKIISTLYSLLRSGTKLCLSGVKRIIFFECSCSLGRICWSTDVAGILATRLYVMLSHGPAGL